MALGARVKRGLGTSLEGTSLDPLAIGDSQIQVLQLGNESPHKPLAQDLARTVGV